MLNLSISEMFFYGGIIVMSLALVVTVLCIVVFGFTGHILRQKLEQEYGKPMQYNLHNGRERAK